MKRLQGIFIGIAATVFLGVSSGPVGAWKFTVIGDPRPGTGYDHSQNAYGAAFMAPNSSRVLVFENGDLTLDGTDAQWADYRSIISVPLGIPTDNSGWLNAYGLPKIISAVGNHDTHQSGWQTRWQTYLPAQAGLTAYADIPGHPQGLYGSVKYGNAIFVWADYYSLPSGQEAFLANTLARAKSDPQITWKFVTYHSPAVSCGGSHSDWGQGKTWHDKYFYPDGVDMVFAGDNHYYERDCPFKGGLVASGGSEQNVCDVNNLGSNLVNPDGVIHVVSGGGGAGLYAVASCPFLAKNQNGAEAAFSLHQFMDIEINGGTLHARVYDTDTGVGTSAVLTAAQAASFKVIDDFTITKAVGPTPTPGGPTPTPTGIPTITPTRTPTPIPILTPTPTILPTGCITVGNSWNNSAFINQTGIFTASFEAIPSGSGIDSFMGLSDSSVLTATSLAAIVRFYTNGNIEARNGGAYQSQTVLPYSSGLKYHFRLEVNIPNHTYTIYVTPQGGNEVVIGENYAFRTEQAAVSQLNNLGAETNTTGANTQICNLTVAPLSTTSPTPTGTVKLGDYNHDGDVDYTDLSVLLSVFDQFNTAYNLIGSTQIDIFDFNKLSSGLGR